MSSSMEKICKNNQNDQIVENLNLNDLLEKLKQYDIIIKQNVEKIESLENKFNDKNQECNEYKNKIGILEFELSKANKIKQQMEKDNEEVENLKIQSEDTLTRAKSIIFDKTKLIKNQELQIDALTQQINGLKDVVQITKDLLEIRNLEVNQLEGKIKCMSDKINAEKERQNLMHKKLEQMIRYNGELKREYEAQLCLFKALRERYNERELAKNVVDELYNNKKITKNSDENKENE